MIKNLQNTGRQGDLVIAGCKLAIPAFQCWLLMKYWFNTEIMISVNSFTETGWEAVTKKPSYCQCCGWANTSADQNSHRQLLADRKSFPSAWEQGDNLLPFIPMDVLNRPAFWLAEMRDITEGFFIPEKDLLQTRGKQLCTDLPEQIWKNRF